MGIRKAPLCLSNAFKTALTKRRGEESSSLQLLPLLQTLSRLVEMAMVLAKDSLFKGKLTHTQQLIPAHPLAAVDKFKESGLNSTLV